MWLITELSFRRCVVLIQTSNLQFCFVCYCRSHAGLPINMDLQMTFAEGGADKPSFNTFSCKPCDSTDDLLRTSGKSWRPNFAAIYLLQIIWLVPITKFIQWIGCWCDCQQHGPINIPSCICVVLRAYNYIQMSISLSQCYSLLLIKQMRSLIACNCTKHIYPMHLHSCNPSRSHLMAFHKFHVLACKAQASAWSPL